LLFLFVIPEGDLRLLLLFLFVIPEGDLRLLLLFLFVIPEGDPRLLLLFLFVIPEGDLRLLLSLNQPRRPPAPTTTQITTRCPHVPHFGPRSTMPNIAGKTRKKPQQHP
jgi:hypothetical protein